MPILKTSIKHCTFGANTAMMLVSFYHVTYHVEKGCFTSQRMCNIPPQSVISENTTGLQVIISHKYKLRILQLPYTLHTVFCLFSCTQSFKKIAFFCKQPLIQVLKKESWKVSFSWNTITIKVEMIYFLRLRQTS